MMYAIDWAHKERKFVIVNEKLEKLTDVKFKKTDKILIENSFPKAKILNKLNPCTNIFVIPGKVVHDNNEKEKSDLEDARTIMKLYQENPFLFNKFTPRDFKEIKLLQEFKVYEIITKDIARMKILNQAMENEYGRKSEHYSIAISELEKEKKAILKRLEPYFKKYIEKVKDINGLGLRYLSGILLYAHPRRFPNLTAYLRYTGHKCDVFWADLEKRKRAGKYNHMLHSLFNQVVKQMIMAKDKKYYALYQKIKKVKAKENPDWQKARIDDVARNRVATFLAKEIYNRFKAM